MKKIKILVLLFGLVHTGQNSLRGQTETEIKSEINKVIVYTQGAQIESIAEFDLQPGKNQVSFTHLSPYIHKESIRVDGDENYTILNVQVRTDFLNQLDKNKSISSLIQSIQVFQDKIEDEENGIAILKDKIEFLNENRVITGKEQAVNPEVYKAMSTMYGDNIEKYSMEILKRKRLIKGYQIELDKLNNQLLSLNLSKDLPSGTIIVTLDVKRAQHSKINFSYLVDNASWYPSYDIRVIDINKPVEIIFRANIVQNTGIDWKNVDLKLSTAKTNISAQIPELVTNYLEFTKQVYEAEQISNSMGYLSNNVNAPAQSQIQIRGIGTQDEKGSLYIVDGIPQTNILNLPPDQIESMNVIKDASAKAIYGSRGANGVVIVTTRKIENSADIPVSITAINETSNEFDVSSKQSIQSDGKLNTVAFKEIKMDAVYEYQSIPKLAKNAYLVGKLGNWTKADLMDGEANIYMGNSYIGKSVINTKQYSDTLDLSFGVDNNILVNREKIKDYSEKQMIGSNKKETYAYKLTIKNNKNYPIRVRLWDQIPISSTKDIQVETLELSGGVMNSNTGKVRWILDLKPAEVRQLILKYSVRYPEEKQVMVE